MNMLVEIKRIFRRENLMQPEKKVMNQRGKAIIALKHRWHNRN